MKDSHIELDVRGRMRAYEFFQDQGYYVLPRLFDDGELEDIKHAAQHEYVHRNPHLSSEIQSPSFKLYGAIQTIPLVKEAAQKKELLDWLELILGPNIILTLNRHNHVSTNSPGSKPDPLHRDHGEWSRGLVSAIVYGDQATIESGCTHILPGSHRLYSPGHAIGTGYWLTDMPSDISELATQALPVPVVKGGVLLFDAHAFHMAGPNTSSANRFSIALGYHSVDQLTHGFDDSTQILVRGNNIYRGNDFNFSSHL